MRKDISKKLRLVIVALALLAGAVACRDSKPVANNANRAPEPAPAPAAATSQPEIVPVEAEVMERVSPFNHSRAEHKKLECSVCHQRTDNEPAPKFSRSCRLQRLPSERFFFSDQRPLHRLP